MSRYVERHVRTPPVQVTASVLGADGAAAGAGEAALVATCRAQNVFRSHPACHSIDCMDHDPFKDRGPSVHCPTYLLSYNRRAHRDGLAAPCQAVGQVGGDARVGLRQARHNVCGVAAQGSSTSSVLKTHHIAISSMPTADCK